MTFSHHSRIVVENADGKCLGGDGGDLGERGTQIVAVVSTFQKLVDNGGRFGIRNWSGADRWFVEKTRVAQNG